MSKYKISKEFKLLKGMKLPAKPELLPIVNTFLELMRGRSDKKVTVQKIMVPGYEETLIPVYVIKPKELAEVSPCLFDIHGGGFMMKGSPAHFARAKEYAYKLNCTVVFPDYRLIPEYPYPTPFEDCFAVYEWMIAHAVDLKIDTQKIAVLGDSAGGNLAAAVTLRIRDKGLPMPQCQMLIYPVLDRRMQTRSMKMYTDTPVWDARLSKIMWEFYLRDLKIEEDANAPVMIWNSEDGGKKEVNLAYISPAEAEDVSGMPDVYIEVAQFDCLRDEGILFADKLKEAGNLVELHKVPGSVHGYDVVMGSGVVKKLMERRVELLHKYFESMK